MGQAWVTAPFVWNGAERVALDYYWLMPMRHAHTAYMGMHLQLFLDVGVRP